MSRLGKRPIEIPEKTEVGIQNGFVTIKGPLGELTRTFRPEIKIEVKDKEIRLMPVKETIFFRALWGTYASHLKNMIHGVNKPYEKKLIIEGIGFRAQVSAEKLTLNVGFSHPVLVRVPDGLKVVVEKNVISVAGINKELVSQFAAHLRAIKKPEPYKGKGIRYENEIVRRKQGKKAA